MALRKWSWGVASLLLLATPIAQAQYAAACIQDDPTLTQQARVAEPEITPAGDSDSLDVARNLNDAGAAALERSALVKAQTYHRRALAIGQKWAPQSLMVAESLNGLASVALEVGDFATAKGYLERSLRIRRARAPGSRDWALSLIGLGDLARRLGDVIRQQAYYTRALEVGDALTPADLADVLDGLGTACSRRPCSQKPQYYFYRALQLRQPDSLGMAGTLGYLGRNAANEGDLQEAEQDLAKALELRRRLAPGSLALATSLSDLGDLARVRGNLAAAELCLRQALQIRQRLAPHSLAVADSLHNLGIVFWLRNDLVRAQDYFDQTLRMRRKLAPGSPMLAQSLLWQGLLYVRRNELSGAQGYFGQALKLLEKDLSLDSLGVAAALSNLGNIARIRGEVTLSQGYYRRALDIQDRQAHESPAEAATLQSLGGLARQQGDLAGAESYYRHALAIQEQKVPDSSGHAGVLFLTASLLRQEHKWDEAERLYAQAVDVLERQTASLGGTPEERSIFRARYENNYKNYVDFLLALGRSQMALQVLERARAWALLEMLDRAQVSVHGNHDSGLDRAKHSLEEQIGATSSYRIRLLDGSHTAAQLSELDQRLSQLRERYRETEEQLQLQNPSYAALTHPQTLTGQQIQDLLDDKTLLLEYSLGPGASHVWAVTHTSLTVYGLPSRNTIEQAVSRVRALMTARSGRPKESDLRRHQRLMSADARYPAAAQDLSRMVLGPVAALLEQRRIVVVSDGALQYLPFAALPTPSGQVSGSRPRSPGKPGTSPVSVDTPLVMQHEVTNLPSASVLAELRRQALARVPAPKAVAVLADPVFDSRDERIERSDPNDTVPAPIHSSVVLPQRSLSAGLRHLALGPNAGRTPAGYLDRLLWTRLEAAEILKVTPAGEGLQALDFEASRATALSPMLAQYRVVHFATHAVSDSDHPERSGLVLSLFDRRGQPQNGFLGLEQIYGLNLPADLVVLSACDTGLGREIGGEGLVGLVRGFMYAGATRVIASLWNVDDEVTAQLMARFYKSLEQDGLSPAAALRAAQIEVLKQSKWSSPYFWAGFQIEGEWR